MAVADLGMAAESATGPGLSYLQLVRRRFTANAYGMAGMFGCLLVVLSAVFAGFIAPYAPATKDRAAIYSPPQGLHIVKPDGSLGLHALGYREEMDDETFEITFVADETKLAPVRLFVAGDEWSLLGMTFATHLFGTEDGGFIHLLGTDGLGRDVFSRMIHSTKITLAMGLIVTLLACLLGTVIGVSSGYFAGRYDLVVQRIVEFVKSFPDLPLYLALVALLPRRIEPLTIFLAFAAILFLLRWPELAREMRGKVLAVRSHEYVRAARAVGATDWRIIFRHVIPNTSSHIIVWATYQLPEVILLESFLSFLGVGVQAPLVSWGLMLNQVRDFQSFAAAPWLLAPVGMIIISVLAFNAFGDGMRDAMDPYSNA